MTQTEQPAREGDQPQAAQTDGEAPPRLADGIELIGKYEDSGFKEPPYIARRADGQVIQLPQLLYVLAEETDGERGYDELATRLSERVGKGVSADNVKYLADEKLRPLGVLAQADGSSPQLQKVDPMLALRLRAAVIPASVVNAITTIFKPLFYPPVVIAVLIGLVAFDAWLFFSHGVAQSAREVLYQPTLLLMLLGLVILSAAFHECGHATACRYGGAKPGAMGVGLYIVWPAFYTDVTDAYRLGKGGRLRTDLGGIYFNVIFILATGAAYVATGYEPLLLIVPIMHLEILHQLLPFLRLDGYYIVGDMTGVPDMFSRIKPTLKSLIPWRKASDRVQELKPWVRVAVTGYVLTVIPVLILVFGLMVISAPRIFATAWDSLFIQYDKISEARSALAGVAGGLQMGLLVLPAAGIAATFASLARRIAGAAWSRAESPVARSGLVAATAAAAGLTAFLWWPNGEYKPIQPGERGTIGGGIAAFEDIPSGRPALTPERERALGGAPSLRERPERSPVPARDDIQPTGTEPAGTTPAETETTPTTTTETTPAATQTTTTETTPASTTTTETTPTTTTQTTTTQTTTTP